jgi:hypothetical protein
LRLQLVAFQRKRKRPVLTTFDRMFWMDGHIVSLDSVKEHVFARQSYAMRSSR